MGTNYIITFPVAFANKCYCVYGNHINKSNGGGLASVPYDITTMGFKDYTYEDNNHARNWLALGV